MPSIIPMTARSWPLRAKRGSIDVKQNTVRRMTAGRAGRDRRSEKKRADSDRNGPG